MKALKYVLMLTVIMLVGVGLAFYFQPPSVDERIKLGETLGGDFKVQSSQGELKLSDFSNKIVLLFFGYTSCPDVCPTSMAISTQAFQQLSKEEIDSVAGIFLSVDPDRDTLEKLDQYTSYFHSNFYGVTAEKTSIDKIVRQYGGYYRKVDLGDSALGYAVDHSSRFYIINQQGELAKALPHTVTPRALADEIRALL